MNSNIGQFLYSNSRFEIIFLESMRFWATVVDGGEASPSSKKLIMGNPEIWLDFRLSFLDEFLKDFAGTFLVFGLWLGVARSPFLEQFYLYRFLENYFNFRIEIISMRFLRHRGSAAGFGWSSSVIALDWSQMRQLLVTIPVFSI